MWLGIYSLTLHLQTLVFTIKYRANKRMGLVDIYKSTCAHCTYFLLLTVYTV